MEYLEMGWFQRWLSSLARRPPVDSGGVTRIERRYIYIFPTGYGFFLGFVLILMLLGSLNYQNNLALLFTFLMASASIVSMFHTWLNLLDLRILAEGNPPVFTGQDAVFVFIMEDDRRRHRGDLVIRAGNRETRLARLDANASDSASISIVTKHRGRIGLESVRLETSYPLGLFRAWSYPQTNAHVTVYPRPANRSSIAVPISAEQSSEQGDLGVGADDFVGPRGYQPGDSLRRLDWKAWARGRGLVIKQFGGDKALQVWIDWNRLEAGNMETRLSILCRQILDAAELSLSYGLRLPGTTVPVGQGEKHKHRCLESLADFSHG